MAAKKADMLAIKKMLGMYVFGPPLTNPRDPILIELTRHESEKSEKAMMNSSK